MLRRLMLLLSFLARALRQLASLGALLLSIRFAWLAGGDVLKEFIRKMDAKHDDTKSPADLPSATDTLREDLQKNSAHRPDLNDLREKAGDTGDMHGAREHGASEAEQDERRPQNVLRRLLIDIGPTRSEVYVRGRLVGQTPYVGQISCLPGESIKIEVLPPRGAPLFRHAECRGETILANE